MSGFANLAYNNPTGDRVARSATPIEELFHTQLRRLSLQTESILAYFLFCSNDTLCGSPRCTLQVDSVYRCGLSNCW